MFNNYQMKKLRHKNVCLFLVGLFSYTSIRIIGTIGISELALVILCPYVFVKDFSLIIRERMGMLFLLSFLWLCGAVLSDCLANTPFQIAIRGVAFPIVTFAALTCISNLLRDNLMGLKYIILGMFFSYIISIFAFQSHVTGGYEANSVEAFQAVVEYKLFWPLLISNIVTLPIQVWYFAFPIFYTLLGTFICAFVDLYFGGRSLFLIGLTSFTLVLSVRKNIKNILTIKRKMIVFVILIVTVGLVSSYVYKYAIKNGYLGLSEEKKYQQQTKQGEGIIDLLLSGRSDFFVSMFAAMDRPILGWGTHALDENGYMIEFARKYGADESIESAIRWSEMMGGAPRLPMHSHLTGFWCWHGIFGGLFWIYVIYICVKGVLRGVSNYPPVFGYLAIVTPFQLWTMLFSPYSHRIPECTLIIVSIMIINMKKPNSIIYSNPQRR